MASEKSSGGRKGRASGPRGKSSGAGKKSGWVKPDGTPLRRRKGEYFPDSEIEKRKPAQRSKTGTSRPYNRDRNSDDRTKEGVSRPYNKGSEDFSRKPTPGNERSYDKSPSGGDERSGDYKSKSERPFREERPVRSDKKDSYKDYKSRASRSVDDRPSRSNREDRAERPSRDDRPTRSTRDDRAERPSRDDRPARSTRDDRAERPSRDDRPARSTRDDRAERPSRDDRPSRSNREDRPARSSDDRSERPSRDDRPVNSDRERSSESPRRDYVRKDSGKKPFEKKRERYADRDHSKEMRGRFDKRNTKGGFEKRAPKSRSSFQEEVSAEGVRLNKFIANAGICSRREADDLITAGVISVNGEIVTELGTKVLPTDEVKFHEQTLRTEKMVYVLLNKPKDYITTTDDPEERKTVMNLVHDAGKERIFPVGRLDRNTTGLLLITNDGELTKRLTHPSSNIKKIYQVELDRNLSQDDMLRAADGVELEDGPAHVDEIHYESPSEKNIVGVELHSGRNRVVRRIFEAMDYKVKKLDRVYFAGLTKKDLPRGRWRFLTELEVNMLKMQTGKKRG